MDIRSDLSFANPENLNTRKFPLMSRGLGLHAAKIFSDLEIRQTGNWPPNESQSVFTKSIILGSIDMRLQYLVFRDFSFQYIATWLIFGFLVRYPKEEKSKR
jgi:hypothetical protein